MALSREDILCGSDRVIEKVAVPEWNGDVYVRTLTVEESLAFNDKLEAMGKTGDTSTQLALQVAAFLCDEHGNQLITNDEDALALIKKRMPAIVRISAAGNKLNNSGAQDAVKEK